MRRCILVVFPALLAGCSPDATPANQAPGLDLADRPAVEGITRATLRDDARVTVTRVHFEPGAAEPIHTHHTDIMVIPVGPADVRWVVAGETLTRFEPGEVQFVPAGTEHQLANVGQAPFEIVAVAVK